MKEEGNVFEMIGRLYAENQCLRLEIAARDKLLVQLLPPAPPANNAAVTPGNAAA